MNLRWSHKYESMNLLLWQGAGAITVWANTAWSASEGLAGWINNFMNIFSNELMKSINCCSIINFYEYIFKWAHEINKLTVHRSKRIKYISIPRILYRWNWLYDFIRYLGSRWVHFFSLIWYFQVGVASHSNSNSWQPASEAWPNSAED